MRKQADRQRWVLAGGKHGRSGKKRIAGWLAVLAFLAVHYSPFVQDIVSLPSEIRLFAQPGGYISLDSALPVKWEAEDDSLISVGSGETDVSGEGIVVVGEGGETALKAKWLGMTLKTIRVEVAPEYYVSAGGDLLGIALYTKGIMIAGFIPVEDEWGREVSPGENAGLQAGDILLTANGIRLDTAEQLAAIVQNCPQGVVLEMLRGEEEKLITVKPVCGEDRIYRLGLWVRDSSAGIGTLTYRDVNKGTYGALGHAVADAETGSAVPVQKGVILPARLHGITRGLKGTAGELKGSFSAEDEPLGTIGQNTEFGIFGRLLTAEKNADQLRAVPIGGRVYAKKGSAQILSAVEDGVTVKAYDCEIQELYTQNHAASRSMVIRITDEDLLSVTGGIVQGMSGSPIIQDGRLIGAVTHVFVNDPTRGYGVYVDWMLENSDLEAAG